jgi:hypothetical protein
VLSLDSLVDRCEIFWCYSISLVDDYVAHDWPNLHVHFLVSFIMTLALTKCTKRYHFYPHGTQHLCSSLHTYILCVNGPSPYSSIHPFESQKIGLPFCFTHHDHFILPKPYNSIYPYVRGMSHMLNTLF